MSGLLDALGLTGLLSGVGGLLGGPGGLFGGPSASPPMATRGGFAARYGNGAGGLLDAFDPAKMRQQAISQALIGAGTGLMSTPGWGAGIAQGLADANRGLQYGKQSALADALSGLKIQLLQAEMAKMEEDAAAQAQYAQDLADLANNPPATWTSDGRSPQEWARNVRVGGADWALKQYTDQELIKLTGPGGVDFTVDPNSGMTSLFQPGVGQVPYSAITGSGAPAAQPAATGAAPPEYESTIQKAAAEYGIPADGLRELLRKESNFDPQALGPALPSGDRAAGIAQFIPGTAAQYGIDPMDPQESIYGAARYLSDLHKQHGGDWRKVLAAYGGAVSPDKIAAYADPLLPFFEGEGQGEGQPGQESPGATTKPSGEFWSQYLQPKQAAESDPIKIANDLRGEFTKITKDYRDVSVAYEKVKAAADNPTPNSGASDIALIFGFMKMLDPSSTVREGEYATAENSGGVPAQVYNMYNRVLSGQFLTPEQRADFAAQAGQSFGIYERQYNQYRDQYTTLAERLNVSPQDVIIEGGVPGAVQPEPTVTVDGISGTWTGRYDGDLPVYRTSDGREFVVEP